MSWVEGGVGFEFSDVSVGLKATISLVLLIFSSLFACSFDLFTAVGGDLGVVCSCFYA